MQIGHERELYARSYPTGWTWGFVIPEAPQVPLVGAQVVVRPDLLDALQRSYQSGFRWSGNVPEPELPELYRRVIVRPQLGQDVDRTFLRWPVPEAAAPPAVPPFGALLFVRPQDPFRNLPASLRHFIVPELPAAPPPGNRIVVEREKRPRNLASWTAWVIPAEEPPFGAHVVINEDQLRGETDAFLRWIIPEEIPPLGTRTVVEREERRQDFAGQVRWFVPPAIAPLFSTRIVVNRERLQDDVGAFLRWIVPADVGFPITQIVLGTVRFTQKTSKDATFGKTRAEDRRFSQKISEDVDF